MPNFALVSPGGQKNIARQSRCMAHGQGWRCAASFTTPAAGSKYQIYEQVYYSDEYWTFNPRYLFANWDLTSSTSNQESDNADPVQIEGVQLVYNDISGAEVSVALKFDGAASVTLTAGGATPHKWTDAPSGVAIPPNSRVRLRTAAYFAGAKPTPYFGYAQSAGERVEVSASSLAAKLAAGGIATTVPSGNDVYPFGAIGAIAQGWDGRPVPLLIGTSITHGQGEARFWRSQWNELGHVGRGLTSKAGGALRLPNMNFSVPGATLQGLNGINSGQGFYRRKQAIDAAGLSTPPFTSIGCDLGTNDATGTFTWKVRYRTTWTALKAAFPALPLWQLTMPPRNTSNDAGQTIGGLSAYNSNYGWPVSHWQYINEWIMAGDFGVGPLDRGIDLNDYWDNYPGGGTKGKMRVDALSSWQGTLNAAVSAGATSIQLVDGFPPIGGVLAFTTDNPECAIPYAISGSAEPYTVNLMSAVASSHASGGTVKLSNSVDFTHPGALLNQKVADTGWRDIKLAGLIL